MPGRYGSSAVLGDHYGHDLGTRADRAIGELVVRWGARLLVGFENHGGGTYLGPTAQPLRPGADTATATTATAPEGAIRANAVGTHLRGPCLPKNPALADYLIGAALSRRYGAADLPPLIDDLELAARQAAVQRARAATRTTYGKLRKTALTRAGLAHVRPGR